LLYLQRALQDTLWIKHGDSGFQGVMPLCITVLEIKNATARYPVCICDARAAQRDDIFSSFLFLNSGRLIAGNLIS